MDAAFDGSLSNDGGTIAFKGKGSYTLTATATDDTGRSFTHSKNVTVYPVPGIAFELPATSHTDTVIEVSTSLTDMDGLTTVWSLTHNGEAVTPGDYIDGTLTDQCGSIRFKEKGRVHLDRRRYRRHWQRIETSASITVYPIGAAGFYLPEITHTDETVAVETTFENIDSATRNGR